MTTTQSMHLLAEPGAQETVITRVFEAPRERVFAAMIDPDAIPLWWGPRRFATIVDALDARPGGAWRFINRDADGTEYAFHGVYHEVSPPERIVQTMEFEPEAGSIVLEILTLEDLGGRTKVVVHSVFPSVAMRDGWLEHGMEAGAAETYDRLAEFLAAE